MKTTIQLLGLLAFCTSAFAQAPDNRESQPMPPRGPKPPLMVALDADGDDEISAEEIANAVEALGALDKNGDGKITMEELRPKPPVRDAAEDLTDDQARPAQDPQAPIKRPPPVIEVLDQDHDGKLSKKELAKASDALKSLDENGDDELSGEEMFGPPRPEHERPKDEEQAQGPPPGNQGQQPPRQHPPRGGKR